VSSFHHILPLVCAEVLRRYELYEPLNTLWRGYISELLSLPLPPSPDAPNPNPPPIPNIAVIHAKLVKADYHGCIITGASKHGDYNTRRISYSLSRTVKRSKNPSLVGMSGIVIHETENTFKVITTNDRLKSRDLLCIL
jgi:ribonuclease P protein subunit POP4